MQHESAKRKKLMSFLRQGLPGSLLQPVSDGSDLLLSIAVDSPHAEARRLVLFLCTLPAIVGSSATSILTLDNFTGNGATIWACQ